MIAPSLSVFPPAVIMSKRWNALLVLNIQDMWPEALMASGLVRSRFLLRIVSTICEKVYEKTNQIVVISNGFKNNLVEKGVPKEKIHVISNSVDVDKYSPQKGDVDLSKRLGMYGKFNFVYAGTMGPSQDLETVIEAAERIQKYDSLQIVLVGDGNKTKKLKEKTRCNLI